MKKSFGSIKVKLILLMLFVVMLITLLMGVSGYLSVSKHYEEMDLQRRALLEENILKLMQATDNAYQMMERQMEKEAEIVLKKIADKYRLEGLNGINLLDYYDKEKDFDLYIIDKTDTVIAATYAPDIGLNLDQYEGVAEFFQGIREKGAFFSDRLSLSSIENIVTKYSYLPSPDGLYLFETGHHINKEQAIPESLNFGNFGDVLSENQRFVLSALLFGKYGVTFNEDASQVKQIDPAYRPYYEQALSTLLPVSFEGTYNGRPASIKYLPFSLEQAGDLHEHTVIELIYSNADLQASKHQMIIQTILIGLLGTAVVAAIGMSIANMLIKPLHILHRGIEEVSRGNYDSSIMIRSNDEFAYIAERFNEMTEKIKLSMEDQLHKEGEIKTLYENEASLNENLQRMMESNEQNYFETIKALANAEEEKDAYTRGHCERVMNYALNIANALGLPQRDINAIRFGAILHDIGKIGVPEQILNKEVPLSNEEFALIRQHPSIGIRILGDLTFMKDSIRIVHEHHERYDGCGYPSRMKGEEIDLLARIVCVADAFDAMTSTRPYRKTAMTVPQAAQILQEESGKQFDPRIVSVFLSLLEQGRIKHLA